MEAVCVRLLRECARQVYWGSGGAGMLFVCRADGTLLLLLRSDAVSQPGTWGVAGGGIGEDWVRTPVPRESQVSDPGVFMATALREAEEECGSLPPGFTSRAVVGSTTYEDCGFRYRTFICDVTLEQKEAWTPQLRSPDGETSEFKWFHVEDLPPRGRLHFGTSYVLPSAISLLRG